MSKEQKLSYLKERLIENFCTEGACSADDWQTINSILEKARRAE